MTTCDLRVVTYNVHFKRDNTVIRAEVYRLIEAGADVIMLQEMNESHYPAIEGLKGGWRSYRVAGSGSGGDGIKDCPIVYGPRCGNPTDVGYARASSAGTVEFDQDAGGDNVADKAITYIRFSMLNRQIAILNMHAVAGVESGNSPANRPRRMAKYTQMMEKLQDLTRQRTNNGWTVIAGGDLNVDYHGDEITRTPNWPYVRMNAVNMRSSFQSLGETVGTHGGSRMIDYVAHTIGGAVTPTQHSVLTGYGSDHKPLMVNYEVTGTGEAPPEPPPMPADSGDGMTISYAMTVTTGTTLTDREIAGVAQAAGFRGIDLTIAIAVCLAESGGDRTAHNTANSNGSADFGLWQINSVHEGLLRTGTWSDAYDNAEMAKAVWDSSGWGAWVTYNENLYAKFMSRAEAVDTGTTAYGGGTDGDDDTGGYTNTGTNPLSPLQPLETDLTTDQPILVPELISQTRHTGAVCRIPANFGTRKHRDGLAVLFRPGMSESLQLAIHKKQNELIQYSPDWEPIAHSSRFGEWGVLNAQRTGKYIYGLIGNAKNNVIYGFRCSGPEDFQLRWQGPAGYGVGLSRNADIFVNDPRPGDPPRVWFLRNKGVLSLLDTDGGWNPGNLVNYSGPNGAANPALVHPWAGGEHGGPELWWFAPGPERTFNIFRSRSSGSGFYQRDARRWSTVGPFRRMQYGNIDSIVFRVVRDANRGGRLWMVVMEEATCWLSWSGDDGKHWSPAWTAEPGLTAVDDRVYPRPSVAHTNTGHILATMDSGESYGYVVRPGAGGTAGAGGGKWQPPFNNFVQPISNGYGAHNGDGTYSTYHTGTDFNSIPEGGPIRPVGQGTVHTTGYQSAYGNFISIDHGKGVYTFYGHMASPTLLGVGDAVTTATVLGNEGATGNTEGVHLHLELRLDSDTYYGTQPPPAERNILPYLVGGDDRPDPPRGIGAPSYASESGGYPTAASAGRYHLGAVKPHVAAACVEIAPLFGIKTVHGYGQRSGPSDHPKGLALDFMCREPRGSNLAAYVVAHANRLQAKYVIYRQRINNLGGGGWDPMGDEGSPTANHMDHVHVSFNA